MIVRNLEPRLIGSRGAQEAAQKLMAKADNRHTVQVSGWLQIPPKAQIPLYTYRNTAGGDRKASRPDAWPVHSRGQRSRPDRRCFYITHSFRIGSVQQWLPEGIELFPAIIRPHNTIQWYII